MSVADNIAASASKIAYTDYFATDLIVYAGTINYSVSNSVGATIDQTQTTNINNYGRPLGIFSYDGGVTYNDFVPTSLPGGSVITGVATTQPSVFVTAEVGVDGTITLHTQVKATVGGGSTIPIIAKILVLATDLPNTMTGVPVIAGASNKQSSGNIFGASPVQYRQIITAASVNASGSSDVATIAHGLGAVPLPEVWFYNGVLDVTMTQSNGWDSRNKPIGTSGAGTYGVAMDATNFYFGINPGISNSSYKYRTYKEN